MKNYNDPILNAAVQKLKNYKEETGKDSKRLVKAQDKFIGTALNSCEDCSDIRKYIQSQDVLSEFYVDNLMGIGFVPKEFLSAVLSRLCIPILQELNKRKRSGKAAKSASEIQFQRTYQRFSKLCDMGKYKNLKWYDKINQIQVDCKVSRHLAEKLHKKYKQEHFPPDLELMGVKE